MLQKVKNFYHKLQAILANIRYGFPAKNLVIIGVTGSDGKTTTVSMIYHILKESRLPVGMISTVEVRLGNQSLKTGLHVTSPDPWILPKYLKMMKKSGVKYVVLETTSSGLDQNRFAYIKFDSGAITNIGSDHLDYHKTWERYAKAKFSLLEQIKEGGLAVLNLNDRKSAKWIYDRSGSIKQEIFVKWFADEDIANKRITSEGLSFEYEDTFFKVPIIGNYNFDNCMQAISICNRYLSLDQIKLTLETFKTPKGRMQVMQVKPFTVIVDFAHTPDALKGALESIREIKQGDDSRIISVFGCAGKRDKGRRKMGVVSAVLADITILTAEDPRNEELGLINNEILGFAEKGRGVLVDRFANRKLYQGVALKPLAEKIEIILKNSDKPFLAFDENTTRSREDAIDLALKLARPGDIVYITGKGHEESLAFGDDGKEFPWSDQEVVKHMLVRMAKEA